MNKFTCVLWILRLRSLHHDNFFTNKSLGFKIRNFNNPPCHLIEDSRYVQCDIYLEIGGFREGVCVCKRVIYLHKRCFIYHCTIVDKNNATNDKFYRNVAFLMYTEMVNFRPQS